MDIRSRRVSEGGYHADTSVLECFSTNGRIVVDWGPWNLPGAWRTSWTSFAPGSKPRRLTEFKQRWSALGFGIGVAGSSKNHLVQVEIPHLACILIFLAMGIEFTRRLRAQLQLMRREARGLCPACGYDLRATPDRCPECGWRPKRRAPTFVPSDDALAQLGGGDSAPEQRAGAPPSDEPTHSSSSGSV
jgi:hypothetical protein